MSRAYGANAQLLGLVETTYGTVPVTDFDQFPFVSSELGSEQGLIASDLLGQGRDPAQPIRDVIKVTGNIVVPVDVRNFGHWLKALLGAPVTTGSSSPYTHTFKSGAATLPSMSIEIGMPEVPAFFMNAGVRVNSCQLNFATSGAAEATLACIAQGETKNTTSQGGTPTALTTTRFNQFQGSIKKDGTQLGNVTGGQLTYTNNLATIQTIRPDGKIDGTDPTIAALTGNLNVRFADTTLIDAATSNTPVQLDFAYTIDANHSLTFTAYEVYLPKPKLSITGPAGVEATFDWQAAKNTSAGCMLQVVLKNDVASYA